jgi:hypothetical protein
MTKKCMTTREFEFRYGSGKTLRGTLISALGGGADALLERAASREKFEKILPRQKSQQFYAHSFPSSGWGLTMTTKRA